MSSGTGTWVSLLELHRSQLAAVVDVVEDLAEPVKGLVRVGAQPQAHERDGPCVAGNPARLEAPVSLGGDRERSAELAVEGQREIEPGRRSLRDARRDHLAEPQPGRRGGIEVRVVIDEPERVVALGIVELADGAELEGVSGQGDERSAVASEHDRAAIGAHGVGTGLKRRDRRCPAASDHQHGHREHETSTGHAHVNVNVPGASGSSDEEEVCMR
jgi:hypothetical protein